jgi:hypothetical protein
MEGSRVSAYLVVTVIGFVVLLSGPLVPQVDLTTTPTEKPSPYCEAHGNASVTVEDVPREQFSVKQRRFGAGSYYISAPDTTVSVENVQGCPVIVYRLTINDLNYFGQRLYFVTEERNRTVSLSVVKGTFTPSDIGAGPYDGTVTILVRGDQKRPVYRTNVTVRVDE